MSARYLKCIQGRLVEEFCPETSICVGSKGTTIFCAVDFSQSSLDAPPSSSQSNLTTAGVNSAVAANTSSAGSRADIPVAEITTGIVPVTATAISNQHIPLQQTSAMSQFFAARSTGGSSARANPIPSPVYLPASFSGSQWTTYMAPQQHTPMPSLQHQQQKPPLPLSSSPLLPTLTNHSQQHTPAYPLQPTAMPSQQLPHVSPMYQPRPNLPLHQRYPTITSNFLQ
ncbi:hypothetical protein BX661DRAFT_171044 [Kickxella alabastrina]|uniref:uncharacterized protein n=1 Tax=Kickxella alabastrina TaxID=61397 RepID=UPI00221FC4E3|nr:uncharacterized protein BX661DRAFT_171044 [Kickxella alabastrina]KAI7827819.1 hypothetical protein BX661DRAFT_171044 [Kickxella alabastrina]